MTPRQQRPSTEFDNIESDSRTRARGKHDDLKLDEQSMDAYIDRDLFCPSDRPEEGPVGPINFEYVTCPTCRGTGSHVNPAIDAGGISPGEFARDPEFAAAYHGGAYDETCGECGGRRVVPKLSPSDEEQEALVERYVEMKRSAASTREMQRAERRMAIGRGMR